MSYMAMNERREAMVKFITELYRHESAWNVPAQEIDKLCKLSHTLDRYNLLICERELSLHEERHFQRKQYEAARMAGQMFNCVVEISQDPRGAAIQLRLGSACASHIFDDVTCVPSIAAALQPQGRAAYGAYYGRKSGLTESVKLIVYKGVYTFHRSNA